MSIRESFVARFGEDNATHVEEAAISHMAVPYTIHKDDKWGSDPFKYLFLVCISHDCFTKWRGYHQIDASYEDILDWALKDGDLKHYEGDIPDYIALLIGAYNPWINWDEGEEPDDVDEWRKRNLDWAHMTPVEYEAESIANHENLKVMVEKGFDILKDRHEEGPL